MSSPASAVVRVHYKVSGSYISRTVWRRATSMPTQSTATPDMTSPATSGWHSSKFEKRPKCCLRRLLSRIWVARRFAWPTNWWASCCYLLVVCVDPGVEPLSERYEGRLVFPLESDRLLWEPGIPTCQQWMSSWAGDPLLSSSLCSRRNRLPPGRESGLIVLHRVWIDRDRPGWRGRRYP